ncbi:NAD(P)H-dependent oxidoreductase [Lutimaribacter marinistellae]|uniref:NAD(P)H-dependent oxidoreductase n=1 Tax=Lutimaribacter marinistellae TaxID=1820329 RepID=A0ABV7TD71_9RHOB
MRPIVYLAHPRLDRSEINGPMFRIAQELPGITCVDLYAEYPTFHIDIPHEQARLVTHDAVIFLHPVYWYSCPALMKEWIDLVFEHGFAYGQDGHALDNKVMMQAVTCGAAAQTYHPDGANGAHLRDLLAPFEKSADLCRMRYLAPFTLFSAGKAEEDGRDAVHLGQWRALLTALRDDTLNIPAARKALTLNDIAATLAASPETA